MAQHDYNIANDSGANVRADINNVLTAIKTLNSGSSAPSSTAPGMSWFDTSNSNTWYWKLRNNADDAWIFVGALDVATDVFQPMIGADELETYLTNNFYTETEMNSLLSAKVSTTGNQTIAGIKTFSSFAITPSSEPTSDYQTANKKYVDDRVSVIKGEFYKPTKNEVLFTKESPSSISIPTGFIVEVNEVSIETTSSVTLNLNSDLDTGTKTAGKDYYVYAKDDSTFYLSLSRTITSDTLIGGFHYGLVGETEAATGNKTEAVMVEIRGINQNSLWDLTWLPSTGDARGMHYKFGLWVDIYQTDEDYGMRGYSQAGGKIAGGATSYGRGIPKIPLAFGGNGTLTYGKYTWFQASEVGKAFGKRLLKYEEFVAFAYGVNEGKSSSSNGYETTAGLIEHYPHLTSSTGMEQAAGVQWVWGADFGTSSASGWNSITDGRGQVYTNANPVLLGGDRDDGVDAGSRCSAWSSSLSYSDWNFGSRFACDHLILD